jgi:hypothetical protein
MATTFFTAENQERFDTACRQLQDAHEDLVALHAEAEVQQTLEKAKGYEHDPLNHFLESVESAIDSLNDVENALEWVSMEVEDEEEE